MGIGDGGGAGRFSPPVLRVMDMAVCGQNERMNEEEGEGVKVVGFLGLVSSKEPFECVYFLVRGVCGVCTFGVEATTDHSCQNFHISDWHHDGSRE